MKRIIHLTSCLGVVALLSFVFLAGCTPSKDGAKDASAKAKDAPKDKKDHDHGETGPHGGAIAEWDDVFHAEFTVDPATKSAIIYILDDKAKNAPKIDAAKITKVKLSITSAKPIVTIDLTHDAKKSNDKGIVFTGTHDSFEKPGELKGTIDGTVDGKPYSGDFKYKHADKSKAARVKEMYLTPGGIYTLADIKANGNTTAAEKFKGKVWEHADNLKVGDRICPVTNNKAEAECAWTVQSQSYQFCCPPCVDKFVGWAHNQPEKVKNANEYVFRGM